MFLTRVRVLFTCAAMAALTCALLQPPLLPAQEEGQAEAEGSTGMPRRTGRSEASGAVGQEGMSYELRGARLVVPPNLPVGSSRLLTFSEDRARLSPADVAEGFRRVGPILRFDGQINASTNPVVVAIRQPRDPSRPGQRLVLAMEQPTICQSETQPRLGSGSLCSTWTLLDATHEGGEVVARMPTPGGYRLVFGTVPIPAAE